MSTLIEAPPEISESHPAVADDAKLLDQLWPGWHNIIDTNTLNLQSTKRCVLGQITGDYDSAIITVNKACNKACNYLRLAPTFAKRDFEGDWIYEIEKRRAAQ